MTCTSTRQSWTFWIQSFFSWLGDPYLSRSLSLKSLATLLGTPGPPRLAALTTPPSITDAQKEESNYAPASLSPEVSAHEALRFVYAYELAALGTSPIFLFPFNETLHAEFPDPLKIFNRAHAILGSIPLVQMVQPMARKAVAVEAMSKAGIHHIRAIPDTARDPGFRLGTAATSAAGAWFSVSHICTTEAAVYSARSNKPRLNRIRLCRSFRHDVCLSLHLVPARRRRPPVSQLLPRASNNFNRKFDKPHPRKR